MSGPASGFVCAQNRNRDGYQLPLALYEAGLLERLVTDFYAPERAPFWLPQSLSHRHADGLPHDRTVNSWSSFVGQAALHAAGLWNSTTASLTDRMIARTAARVAIRRGAGLHCYEGYLPPSRLIARGAPRIVFAYHPAPALGEALLAADNARFPETLASWTRERAIARRSRSADDWRRADAVVCASAMTRASLEHAGCPPERITVVPYGADEPMTPPLTRPDTGRAEFLFVGQGVQRKGLHHLIAAWQAADLADARLTLVCYAIDPGIAATIRSPSIRLLPRQSAAALRDLYAASHVFAMPSLVEGFGLVYLDALVAGCYILGTPNTGLPDLRLPAHAATLVAPGDLDALAASLMRLRDAALADALDPAAIAAAGTDWSWADFRRGIAAHAAGVLAA